MDDNKYKIFLVDFKLRDEGVNVHKMNQVLIFYAL